MTQDIRNKLQRLYNHQESIKKLIEQLSEKHDCFRDISADSLYILEGCNAENNALYYKGQRLARGGIQYDLCFVEQLPSWRGDSYHGNLYFPMDDNGTYLRAYYKCDDY